MDIELVKKELKDRGFAHIYDWHDEPDTEYPAHEHQGPVTLYIVEGGLTFTFGEDDPVTLSTGHWYEVPVGKEHTALVGPEGCTYVVGEMVEGEFKMEE